MPDRIDADPVQSVQLAARLRAGLSPSVPTTLELGLRPRVAHEHDGLTAAAVRAYHLDLVHGVLSAADVPCFVVPGLAYRDGVLGVPESARGRALQALQPLFAAEAGYVAPRLPRPRDASRLLPGDRRKSWTEVESAQVLALRWLRCDPSKELVLGLDGEACDIEFWAEEDGRLRAPRPNRVTPRVAFGAPTVDVHPDDLSELGAPVGEGTERRLRTFDDFVVTGPEDVTFPVDVVYTWVDGTDPAWLRRRAEVVGESYHDESGSTARFLSRDELRYSLRSLHANAPWIRHVWVVTDAQRPPWLHEDDRLTLVDHRDIFRAADALPTFNSHAIESQLHHIDGLSEHFLYFNDDMFLGRPTIARTFFTAAGLTRIFYSDARVPQGPITDDDTPVDAAHKNNRRLLEESYGRTISRTFRHTPYALRRSVLDEIERRYPEDHDQTMRSRFRSRGDLSIPSSLHHFYALLSGRAVASPIDYSYTQLAVPDLGRRLERLLARRDVTTFCLNDAYSAQDEIEGQLAVLAPFLEAYFPVPSPWERMR